MSSDNAGSLLKKLRSSGSISALAKEQASITSASQDETEQTLANEVIKDKKQRREMRMDFEKKVFRLLVGQVLFLGLLILLQGFKWCDFSLDEWVFGIFVNGSLIYTYFIIRYIASDLFNGDSKLLKKQSE